MILSDYNKTAQAGSLPAPSDLILSECQISAFFSPDPAAVGSLDPAGSALPRCEVLDLRERGAARQLSEQQQRQHLRKPCKRLRRLLP